MVLPFRVGFRPGPRVLGERWAVVNYLSFQVVKPTPQSQALTPRPAGACRGPQLFFFASKFGSPTYTRGSSFRLRSPENCLGPVANLDTDSATKTVTTAAMGLKHAKERKKKADKPGFDEAALAQLTSKLDKSLGDSQKQLPPKRKRQRENDDDHQPKRHQTRPSECGPQGELGGGWKSKQAPNLLDEILALGGNEEDLELVANVDSGDEGGDAPRPKVSSETIVDKSLKDELAQFASSLGLSNFHEHDDPETDDEGDEPEEDTEAPEEDKPIAPTLPVQEVRQGKKSGKLVSKQQLCSVLLAAGTKSDG